MVRISIFLVLLIVTVMCFYPPIQSKGQPQTVIDSTSTPIQVIKITDIILESTIEENNKKLEIIHQKREEIKAIERQIRDSKRQKTIKPKSLHIISHPEIKKKTFWESINIFRKKDRI